MLDRITQWFFDLFSEAFAALWDLITDVVIALLDLFLAAVVALLGLIPVPDVLAEGLGSLWAQLDGGIMYIVSALGVPEGLAMLGAAYLFRLGRKLVTLFQW